MVASPFASARTPAGVLDSLAAVVLVQEEEIAAQQRQERGAALTWNTKKSKLKIKHFEPTDSSLFSFDTNRQKTVLKTGRDDRGRTSNWFINNFIIFQNSSETRSSKNVRHTNSEQGWSQLFKVQKFDILSTNLSIFKVVTVGITDVLDRIQNIN